MHVNFILKSRINYDNGKWFISDGDGFKPSMNGTWYRADEYIDLNNKNVIRAGTTSFEVQII